MITMTPKNILSKIVYIIAGCVAVPGLILFVPGGLFILAALIIGCGADKLERVPYDPEDDITIEEYEKANDIYSRGDRVTLDEDDSDAEA